MGIASDKLADGNPGTYWTSTVSNYTPTGDAEADYKAKLAAKQKAEATATPTATPTATGIFNNKPTNKPRLAPSGRRKGAPMGGRGSNATSTAPTTKTQPSATEKRASQIQAQKDRYIANTKKPGSQWSFADFGKKAARWKKMSEVNEKNK